MIFAKPFRLSLALTAAAVAAVLIGCAPEEQMYGPGDNLTYNGNVWRVSDRKDADRLLIVAVDPKLAGLGTIADARHSVDQMPEAEYRAAVMGWFATSGRFCTPDQGAGYSTGGYEFHYSCWHPV